MKRIAIAGGIGAGKSEATDYLARLGYGVIDADEVARKVVEPGQPAWRALRDAFGDAVLQGDGAIDREFLAQVVFADPVALRRLNSITHVQIGLEILRALELASANVVFIALPLFRSEHRTAFGLDEVWSVQASADVALSRLLQLRGMNEDDARARLASQMSNDERAAIVDHVIWNDGTIDALHVKLEEQLRQSGVVDE
ncbi:MAG: dephospho-CoA kinase [Acidobacteria bacterium]|nr:dephospho-CoA kinase [Acidobacteriota bacterium]